LFTIRFLDGPFAPMRLLSGLLTPKGRELFRGWIGLRVRTDVRDVFRLSVHTSLTVAVIAQSNDMLIDAPLPAVPGDATAGAEEEDVNEIAHQFEAEAIAHPHDERVADGTLTAISLEERAERLRAHERIKTVAIAQLRTVCENWNTALEALDDEFRFDIRTVEAVFETYLTGTMQKPRWPRSGQTWLRNTATQCRRTPGRSSRLSRVACSRCQRAKRTRSARSSTRRRRTRSAARTWDSRWSWRGSAKFLRI
jgi:hypothetical protein